MEKRQSKGAGVPSLPADIPFPDEIAHLDMIRRKLKIALQRAEDSVDHLDAEYRDTKRYMVGHRGDIDPNEMFLNEIALKRIDQNGAFAVESRDRIAKLMDSPYFARIDFLEEDENAAERYYIGRFAFSDENELLIVDWRAPIAGMFYDCKVGPAQYDAPQGRIRGLLTLKRQFKIVRGAMEYAIETSENVQDEVLQRELALNSDDKMKSIIATLQREQNTIVRNDIAKTLIIQGVAGSGKTSIALHRVAFLLYRYKERLTAKQVAIISPNRVFGDYIAGVLPELGEEPIFEIGLSDIADIQLDRVIDFERDRIPFESVDPAWSERVRYKSTIGFLRQMEAFVAALPDIAFDAREYRFVDYRVTADWLRARMAAYRGHPIIKRLQMIADEIYDRFTTENYLGEELPKPRRIAKELKAMLKFPNTLSLYREFYRQRGAAKLLVMAGRKRLEWNDVFPFLYLHGAFCGLKPSGQIRHLVIDEMQDYTPIQFAVINRLFPCEKTILGDFGQSINPDHRNALDDLLHLYSGAELVTLRKSYRSTYEIIRFAKRICSDVDIEVIQRHGPEPAVIRCADRDEQIKRITRQIEAFRGGDHHTLGIITKTDRDARALYNRLANLPGIRLITPESADFRGDVHIASVHMAKGLEFDSVILPDADSTAYGADADRRLLYVACTRAMHRLTLLYTGEPVI